MELEGASLKMTRVELDAPRTRLDRTRNADTSFSDVSLPCAGAARCNGIVATDSLVSEENGTHERVTTEVALDGWVRGLSLTNVLVDSMVAGATADDAGVWIGLGVASLDRLVSMNEAPRGLVLWPSADVGVTHVFIDGAETCPVSEDGAQLLGDGQSFWRTVARQKPPKNSAGASFPDLGGAGRESPRPRFD